MAKAVNDNNGMVMNPSHSIWRVVHEMPLVKHVPQRHALALISTGDRHAIAARGAFVAEGDWVWRWKDRIDRAFMAKYALPDGADAENVRAG